MTADNSTETGTIAAEAAPTQVSATKIGRNDACLCGSGKKFKKCCIDDPAYNVPPETKIAASVKAPAKQANAGHPAAKQVSLRNTNAPGVTKTSTKRKV